MNEDLKARLAATDVSATDLADMLAETLQSGGARVGRSGAGGPSAFDFVAVRLPNGQTFTIRIEEN